MKIPELKMEGRSGCELSVEYQDNMLTIKKYSSALSYNKRLIKQAEKQKEFYKKSQHLFTTAEVLDIKDNDNELSYFIMHYLLAEKYSDYLEQIDYREVKALGNKFINYFDRILESSVFEFGNEHIFKNKLIEIEENIKQNKNVKTDYFLKVLKSIFNNMPEVPLPLGNCHGDFTFSNILFGDKNIYLLDFLDSFIESPIIDIVKLRQDTCFKWSILLEKEMPQYKANKIIQIFNYLDKKIDEYCNAIEMNEWYNYLQIINLLRIVPYLKKENEINFIENSLKMIIA